VPGGFDTVICLNVIEHVDDDRGALQSNRPMESISRWGMRSGSVSRRGGIADHETTRMGRARSCLEA